MASKVALHVEEYGSGDPTVVLLHGFGGSARNFRPQARFLAKNHRVILFDARGHARSEAPLAPEEYELDAFVEDFADVVARAGSARVVVGGISMGAAIALRFALAYPDRVAGLVLSSFPQAGDPSPASWARAFATSIEEEGPDVAGSKFVWGGSRFDADGARFIRQGFLEHPAHALVATLRRVLAVHPRVADLADALSHVDFPVLVIVGEEDAGSLPVSRDLALAMRGSSLVVVPGAGHVVNLQKPEAFNGAIQDFLRRFEA